MTAKIECFTQDDRQVLRVPEEFRGKISTFAYQYLQPHGFFNDDPSNDQGYTPWYTYPAIDFLNDILKPEFNVMEYGCGYSTLFYKNKVKELFTIDHNIEWAKKIVSLNNDVEIKVCVENCNVQEEAIPLVIEFLKNFKQVLSQNKEHDLTHGLLNNEFAGYASMIYLYPKNYFDIVVIDGMARSLCGYLAVERVKEDGYIILDNSDRWVYNNLQEYLIGKGFGRIDFWGPGHGSYEKWCTSFFSKNFKITPLNIKRPIVNGPILK